MIRRRVAVVWAAAIITMSMHAIALAQDDVANEHWAFSAFFGSGWYRVADNRSVLVVRVPPRQTVQTASIDSDGRRELGIEIHYPVTLGLNNFSGVADLPGVVDPDNFGTVSFTPGVELEIPVTPRWSLRPLAHLGWGKETSNNNSAWIYYGGVKSRYTPDSQSLDWSLLNSILYAGYSPSDGLRDDLLALSAGAEIHQPVEWQFTGTSLLALNWHATYTWFAEDADFFLTRQAKQSVDDQWEVGLALANRDRRPFKLGFLEFEHIGLAYQWSSDGAYRAITLNFRSPFTR